MDEVKDISTYFQKLGGGVFLLRGWKRFLMDLAIGWKMMANSPTLPMTISIGTLRSMPVIKGRGAIKIINIHFKKLTVYLSFL